MPVLTLRSAATEAHLHPEGGGAFAGLVLAGTSVLRPVGAVVSGPLDLPAWPMLPYCGRIAGGRFVWAGREVTAAAPLPDAIARTIHGVGWVRPWEVTSATADAATLVLRHAPDALWPWPFVAEQRIRLAPHALEVTIALVSAASEPVPVALGWHPYFAKPPGTRLTFAARRLWQTDPLRLPTRAVPVPDAFDCRSGRVLDRDFVIDTTFDGWDGDLALAWSGSTGVRMSASVLDAGGETAAQHLVVYTPPGADFVCLEPQTARPDAHNAVSDEVGHGLRTLAPGGRLALKVRLDADAQDRPSVIRAARCA